MVGWGRFEYPSYAYAWEEDVCAVWMNNSFILGLVGLGEHWTPWWSCVCGLSIVFLCRIYLSNHSKLVMYEEKISTLANYILQNAVLYVLGWWWHAQQVSLPSAWNFALKLSVLYVWYRTIRFLLFAKGFLSFTPVVPF